MTGLGGLLGRRRVPGGGGVGTREGWEPCGGSLPGMVGQSYRPEAALPGEARLPTALSGLKLLEWGWCLNLI